MKKRLLSALFTMLLSLACILQVTVPVASAATTLYWPVPGYTYTSRDFVPSANHYAMDIPASEGSAVVIAAIGGYVEKIYLCSKNHMDIFPEIPTCCYGFGHGLVIKGDDGRRYQYAHMYPGSIPSNVYYNGYVAAGQILGRVGNTGFSQGAHLHFAITTASTSGWEPPYAVNPKNETYTYVSPDLQAPANLGDSFYASISRADSPSELLSVQDALDGTTTFASAANQSAQQRWLFTRQSDGSYKIQSTHSGYVLNVDNGASADGTLAAVWTDIGNNHQLWYIYEVDGGYRISAKSTGKTLTVYTAASSQSAKLYSYTGSAEQILNIHIHSYNEESFPANCQNGGYTRTYCTGCDDFYITSDGTSITDHDWEITGYSPATCKQFGSVTYACTVCDDTYTEETDVVWSDWSTTQPDAENVETKQQYRYRDREQNWAVTENGTLQYVASWPSGFKTANALYSQYNNAPKTTSETTSQKVTVNSDDVVGYIYYHWCRGTYTDGPINRLISNISESDLTAFHAFYSTSTAGHTDAAGSYVADAFYFYNANCCRDSYWYFQIPVRQQTYTIEEKQFDGEKWTAWTEWSDTAITATNDRQVETRTLYRYATEGYADHSWDNGAVTQAPTTTASGIKTYTCTVCKETKSETLPSLGVSEIPPADDELITPPVDDEPVTPPADDKPVTPPAENEPVTPPAVKDNPFMDVPTDAFYHDPVLWAVENSITNGIDATHFGPEVGCTRAHVVTFLWRSAGSPAPSSSFNPFVDVVPGAYYYDAVLWAVENGITNGTSATTFSPDQTCTRGQIVTFLWRYQGSPAASGANSFTDVPNSQYYSTAVAWAVANGITNGMGNGTFAPDATCTRGQIVTFLYRAVG